MKSLYANLGQHGSIGCYDANVLAEIEQEMQIIKVKLEHWTSRQDHIVI